MVSGREKRAYPRLVLKSRIRYWVPATGEFGEGEIENFSLCGFLLWTDRELTANTQIHLLIDSDPPEEPPIRVTATIFRIDPEKKDGCFGYGCQTDTVINIRDWFNLIYILKKHRSSSAIRQSQR